MIQHFERNTAGRDYAVGDIHGCFQMLRAKLDEIGFDETRDRLFSVGDLVDRGPDSENALDWLSRPWFHAVRGNHEQMAIGVAVDKHDKGNYAANGGGWFLRLPHFQRRAYAKVLDLLPIAISVDTSRGKVGIVHADIPTPTWEVFAESLASFGSLSKNRQRDISEIALWSRDRIVSEDDSGVPDLRALVVGHTPGDNIRVLGNVHYIDTGAVFQGGHITVIDLETLS